jgi:hypothetical protein
MTKLAKKPHSTKRSMQRVARHFSSLREELGPSVSMFTQDVPLAIMPLRARDAETYYAKIVGGHHDVERAIVLLRSLTR